MAVREGTVYGTEADDSISNDYVDASGNFLSMFSDNDGSSEPPDHVTVDMGAGDDEFFTWLKPDWAGVWRDHVTVLGGEGNDTIAVDGLYQLETDTVITLDGGAGDDQITLWWPARAETDPANTRVIGGSGADEFRVASFSPDTEITISDFETGQDSLTVMNSYEQWETITADMISVDGAYRAYDTSDGLRIDAYHYLEYDGDGGPYIELIGLIYTFTLTGVTLNDFMAGSGINIINGTDGRDIIRDGYVDADGDYITDGENLVLAGAGHDTVTLTMWNSTVRAGDGRDFVIIKGAGNTVYGEAGNDHLIARHGGSTLDGGQRRRPAGRRYPAGRRPCPDRRRGVRHVRAGLRRRQPE